MEMGAANLNDPQTLNLYTYCGNDHINNVDPDGLLFGNKAIKSRIHSYALLNPLTDREMRHMIDHRCKVAEIRNPFTDEALDRIWEITKGVPRHILKICDKAYDYMNLNEGTEVTLECIDPAAEDAAVEIAKAEAA